MWTPEFESSCSGTLSHQVTLPSSTDIISAEPLPSLHVQRAFMCIRIYKIKQVNFFGPPRIKNDLVLYLKLNWNEKD